MIYLADIYDKKKRSDLMKQVRSKGNKTTELKLIQIFRELGIGGWRRGYPVKGHPDFVFLDRRIAIFVDGCFWHGHDCRNTHPKENKEFWAVKQENNLRHDREVSELFISRGWTVLRIWECELKGKNRSILAEKLYTLGNEESQK